MLRLGDLVIDLRYRRVQRPDGATELPNRMFDLLLLFLARPHALHTRASLFDQVWRGVVVEDANLSQSVWMLRKALGPERRHWIRTVPGSGYVFEPPGPVEAASPVADPQEPAQAGNRPLAGRPASRLRPRPIRAAPATIAAAIAACLLVLASAAWNGRDTAAPRETIAVTLVEVGQGPGEHGWPAKLLHAWLGWKFAQLPEVVLVGEPGLAATDGTGAGAVLLLSSGPAADGSGELVVGAQLASASGREPLQVKRRARPAQVPALVDELSQLLLGELLPARRSSRWPALELDAGGARAYARVQEAREARDWHGMAEAAREVMQRAPGSGLVRFDLAQAQARLGLGPAAREQMALARRLLVPLPDDAAALMEARELALDPHKAAQAAQAWGELARLHPQRHRFVLEHARQLIRAGDPGPALELLETPAWQRQPVDLRMEHQLLVAGGWLLLGDAERARASARDAARMAQAVGPGREAERGQALLMVARAELMRGGEDAAVVMLEQAARQFELAGRPAQARAAQFRARLVHSEEVAHGQELEVLLQEARRDGNRDAEIALLYEVAGRLYQAGRHESFRERLDQAAALANEAGNPYWRYRIGLDLINEDILRGDLHGARVRVEALRAASLQGENRARLAIFEAYLLQQGGFARKALAKLDAAGADGNHSHAASSRLPALARARLACARADLLLQLGDLAGARMALSRCAEAEHPLPRLHAGLLEGRLLHISGRPRAARERLARTRGELEAAGLRGPDRLWLVLGLADLHNHAGLHPAARRLYADARDAAQAAGLRGLLALAETGLAETLVAEGNRELGARHLAAARGLAPAGAIPLARRLDQVAAVLSLAAGDREEAIGLLSRLDAQSHRSGDVLAILEVHSLVPGEARLPGCPDPAPAPAARTGLAGASLAWLAAALPAADAEEGPAGTRALVRR